MNAELVNASWVTLEGVEGVGKTYLGQRLAGRLADRAGVGCRLISEVTDAGPGAITRHVIEALSSAGDVFLRTGHPLTETFALLALKVREWEQLGEPGYGVTANGATELPRPLAPDGSGGRISAAASGALVLEDRGVETVGIYQATILGAGPDLAAGRIPAHLEELEELAGRINAVAERWRPPADRILLLVDDLPTCVQRFAARIGRDVTAQEEALIATAAALYARLAEREPDRVSVVDRAGHSEEETVEELERVCRDLLRSRSRSRSLEVDGA